MKNIFLKEIRKYHFKYEIKEATVGRAITLEREPSKRSKELIPKRMQRGLRVITLQGAKRKVQYCDSNIGQMNDLMAP